MTSSDVVNQAQLSPYFPHRGSPAKRAQPTQGKLFQESKPTPEHRYQKGYTPERMRDVRETMPYEVYPGQKGHFSGPHGEHQVHQIIARSTTPTGEILEKNPDYSKGGGFHLPIHTGSRISGGRRGQPAAAGAYVNQRNAQGIQGAHGEIHLSGEADTPEREGQTLLHELGHWRSNRLWTPHSYVDTPAQRGKEEAFADENMLTRWRPDPRDVHRGTSQPPSPSYESESAHQGIGGQKSHTAYLKARKTPLVSQARIREAKASYKDAAYQPEMLWDKGGSQDPKATGHGINLNAAKPEGPLHPMQFGKL